MKLLLKFNLVFLLVFALGLGVTGYFAREMLQRDAQAEVLDRARLMTAHQWSPPCQTFSISGRPSRPLGRKISTRISTAKAATSLYSLEK